MRSILDPDQPPKRTRRSAAPVDDLMVGADAGRVEVLFINVDPEHDTPRGAR